MTPQESADWFRGRQEGINDGRALLTSGRYTPDEIRAYLDMSDADIPPEQLPHALGWKTGLGQALLEFMPDAGN